MNNRLKANAVAIRAAKGDDAKRVVYSIDGLVGLRLYIEPTGSRSWYYEYKIAGRRNRIHIGDAAVVSLSDARTQALDLRRDVELGGDPKQREIEQKTTAKREAFTFRRLFEKWEQAHQHLKGLKERCRALQSDALPALGDTPVEELTKRDVIDVIDAVAKRGAAIHADHIAAYLSAIFNWGIDEELCENNPAHRIRKRGQARPRERVLTDLEIGALWRCFNGQDKRIGDVSEITCRALKLALLTGQRRGELIAARTEEFDTARGLWTLPGDRTKNSRTHQLPLAPLAYAVVAEAIESQGSIRSAHLFPAKMLTTGTPHLHARSLSKALERICTALGIEGVSMHCFRRTLATRLGDLGTSGDVIARILNHSPQDVTSRHYNHAKMLSQMREALEAWEAEILRMAAHAGLRH